MYHIDPKVPSVLIGDPLRLNQVILNLTENALKFTNENGLVSIELQNMAIDEEHCNLRFLIKDNGIGIELEKQDRIFESFTQADSNTTRKYGGTGLGLSIVKQLIELQGGSIEIESEPGIGTTFILICNLK